VSSAVAVVAFVAVVAECRSPGVKPASRFSPPAVLRHTCVVIYCYVSSAVAVVAAVAFIAVVTVVTFVAVVAECRCPFPCRC